MNVAQFLEKRRQGWLELENHCGHLEQIKLRRGMLPPEYYLRFAALYRGACADLALIDAYHLSDETGQYLHQLVARSHNLLYRSTQFRIKTWLRTLFVDVPRRLFHDNCLRFCFVLFWGLFGFSAFLAYTSSPLTESLFGDDFQKIEEMYASPVSTLDANERGAMTGFYILNNAGIGMRCFAVGILFLGVVIMMQNAFSIGAIFGHMATVPQSENFFEFVTAHGPFELTAIVLSTAAGLRIGYSLIETIGMTREDSLRRGARLALPNIFLAVIFFCIAALIEGFVSPSPAPYWVKATIAVLSTLTLIFYFFVLGFPRGGRAISRTA